MEVQSGYWWAISIRRDDDQPEIIDVRGEQAQRIIGEGDPYDLFEFELIRHVDTGGWPSERGLDGREVDPATIKDGYWWAFHILEEQPEIIRVGQDEVARSKSAYRADSDGEFDLSEFEFLMSIDTSGWPKG
ncbi:hypothetical protein [Mesorhizobium sp. LjNodule214]|uniref:hypothetical protein n=1 Tax=Mesorhizobium sp. LjNodule214 TaxID=3342252 RepID=UPI003ECE5A12